MRLVLDTNILVVIIFPKSKFYWLFEALLENRFTICLTTDVLNEYEEIIAARYGADLSTSLMETLEDLPNVERVTKYFRWELIKVDYDDNKFVDCALACNADYIVTHDKHFNELKNISFPKVKIIDLNELQQLFKLIE